MPLWARACSKASLVSSAPEAMPQVAVPMVIFGRAELRMRLAALHGFPVEGFVGPAWRVQDWCGFIFAAVFFPPFPFRPVCG